MTHIISFVGKSGSGKTTLIEKLVEHLVSTKLIIGTIKHTHHNFELDKKGKDSYRHFNAGATSSMIISDNKIGYVSRYTDFELLSLVKIFFSHCDIVIIEGFKNDDTDKIEVYRKDTGYEPIYKGLKNVIAIATDDNFSDIKTLDINNIPEIANFILKHFGF